MSNTPLDGLVNRPASSSRPAADETVPVAHSGHRVHDRFSPEFHAGMVREVHSLGNTLGPLISLTDVAAADAQTPAHVRNLLAECRELLTKAASATSRLSGYVRQLAPMDSSPEVVGKKPPTVAVAAPSAESLPALQVLCVEDDRSVRELLVKLLKLLGQKVDAVGSATEALVAFGRQHYDIVVTDLRLGAESGQDLTSQLRCIRPIPVIWVTGFDEGRDLSRMTPSAAPTYLLEKPLTLDGLKTAFRIAADVVQMSG